MYLRLEQTFLHYVEQAMMVDYRYFKNFSGRVIQGNSDVFVSTRYFVGNQAFDYEMDLSLLKQLLLSRKMISTFLPGKLFKFIIKTKFEKLLWIGSKNYENQICFRYYKDIRRFQSEPAFIWNILKAELYAKNISNRSLKMINRLIN